MNEHSEYSYFDNIICTYVKNTRSELEERWRAWKIDLKHFEYHEVIGALLSRQVILAAQLAENPTICNRHIAPLLIRAMADVYITMAWILCEPIDRARKFVAYGLGQEKLLLAHRKAMFDKEGPSPDEQSAIDASEDWINMQRYTFLTDVNIGSWSGISTREMADKAHCIDFYNLVYIQFSACTHSMWHHIGKYNLIECKNPLHQRHKVPHLLELPNERHLFFIAADILEKTFKCFDEKVGISSSIPSSYDVLCEMVTNKK